VFPAAMLAADEDSQKVSRATTLIRTGKLDEAEGVLWEVLSRDPKNAQALNLLGGVRLPEMIARERIALVHVIVEGISFLRHREVDACHQPTHRIGELIHLVLQRLQVPRARPPGDGDERGEAQHYEGEQEPRRPLGGEPPRGRRSVEHVLPTRSVEVCAAMGARGAQLPTVYANGIVDV